MQVPVAVSALAFLLPAWLAWRRSPICARVMLGAATVFFIAALQSPGRSVADILEQHSDGLAYLVGAARLAGLAAFLIGMVAFVRERFAGLH
jgi:hypothetical protein